MTPACVFAICVVLVVVMLRQSRNLQLVLSWDCSQNPVDSRHVAFRPKGSGFQVSNESRSTRMSHKIFSGEIKSKTKTKYERKFEKKTIVSPLIAFRTGA